MADAAAIEIVLALARWTVFVSSMLVLGHVGARWILVEPGRRLDRSLTFWALMVVVSQVGLLGAQSYAWFGPAGFTDPANIDTLLRSRWGGRWTWAAIAMISAWIIAAGVYLANWSGRLTAVLIGIVVAASTPLVGHGAQDAMFWMAHGLHLAGAGLWLGTLAVLLMFWPPTKDTCLSKSLLARFSPLALSSAAAVALSGLLLAWRHLEAVHELATTSYGRTLSLKTATVAVVVGLGFFNWRSHRHNWTGSASALRRRAIVETVVAFVIVVGVTAWLSGRPLPSE